MIIVLENEFWDLHIEKDFFEVSLKFKGNIERLKIMFSSVTCFIDPSVSFKLDLKIENITLDKKHSDKRIKRSKKNITKDKIENVILFKPNKK